MRRSKEDEKMMGPMFPRLHVNDTEKGGPRAPPRNKMALYEQFTIPSQRYNSAVVPPKHHITSGSHSGLVPSPSTTQGTSREWNTNIHLHRPPPTSVYEEVQARNVGAVSLSNQQVRTENKKRPLEEDDFMVPIFSQPGSEMHTEERSRNDINGEGHPVSKQQIKDRDVNTARVSASSRNSVDTSIRGKDNITWRKDASSPREYQEQQRLAALEDRSACLPDDTRDEGVPDLQARNPCQDTTLTLRVNSQADCRVMSDDKTNKGTDRIVGDPYPVKENTHRGDGVSETSMVDSAVEFDISPDDVVDIIGRKHFWKARSAIVNQQRVLAVQLFELHRLLKVQKLIAGSPNLLLETSAFVVKSPRKDLAVKKYSSEYVVKDLSHKDIQKDVSPELVDKVEGTAENAVPKASSPVPSQQPPILPVNTNMDPNMNPWVFHQPPSHQWLVPVMSPSEGLVYKPFPAPGFMGTVYGGCGPMDPNHVPANLMNPPYMMPTPQYQQGMPPGIHFGGQSYFPPYGMSMMAPTVSNSTVIQPQPHNQTSQPEGASVNHGQENAIGSITREVQGSTASSPCDREQGTATVPESEGKEFRVRVIRAVPRHSTRESAARIFQSIQQERRLNESR
ncbi:hypothetical protein vseg_005728 [Gypsophila vaccaria]